MGNELESLKEKIEREAQGIKNQADLLKFKEKFLSRKKGEISLLFKKIPSLDPEMRSSFGMEINRLKKIGEKLLNEAEERIKGEKRSSIISERIPDPTLPGKKKIHGSIHPIARTSYEIEEIFLRMGYDIEEGPDVETEFFNFEALNIPKYHPAREQQDTFYIREDLLLRTHTSPVQIRAMRKRKPPIRVIAPGRVFRRDEPDPTHTPMFYQVEGLVVDKGINFSHLKGTLEIFSKSLFGKLTKVRFRPSYFPFTEPSAEVDISCPICGGKNPNCRICGGTGWIEILGAGMVHPKVLMAGGIDPEIYSGFAFGLGVDRTFLIKSQLLDIRYYYENRVEFLEQFR